MVCKITSLSISMWWKTCYMPIHARIFNFKWYGIVLLLILIIKIALNFFFYLKKALFLIFSWRPDFVKTSCTIKYSIDIFKKAVLLLRRSCVFIYELYVFMTFLFSWPYWYLLSNLLLRKTILLGFQRKCFACSCLYQSISFW